MRAFLAIGLALGAACGGKGTPCEAAQGGWTLANDGGSWRLVGLARLDHWNGPKSSIDIETQGGWKGSLNASEDSGTCLVSYYVQDFTSMTRFDVETGSLEIIGDRLSGTVYHGMQIPAGWFRTDGGVSGTHAGRLWTP